MLQRDTGLVNHLLVDDLHLVHGAPVLADRQQQLLVAIDRRRVWRNWPFAFLMPDGRPADHPARAVRGRRHRRRRAGGGRCDRSPCRCCARSTRCCVLVLFLWTFNDFNTPYVLFGQSPPQTGRPDLHPHLPELVRHLELRYRLRDVGAAAAVPAGGHRRLSAGHEPEEATLREPRCVQVSRRVVLTLLAAVHAGAALRDGHLGAQAAERRPGRLPVDPVDLTFQPFIDMWSTVPLAGTS